MIISLALIIAVALYNVSPWVLCMLIFTWIPDVGIATLIFGVKK